MELFYPAYYHKFACLAGACPDSCCKEWEVDVDAAAATRYRTLPGDLGDRLRQVLRDTENGTVMAIEDGRCPMWLQDGLCRIQAELGHDALCQVCQQFPRLRHEYGSFTELGLELSCPAAAQLILSGIDYHRCQEEVPGGEPPEYDTEIMELLLQSRGAFLSFLEQTRMPLPHILAVLLLYAHDVQSQLDGGDPAQFIPDALLDEAASYAQAADSSAFLAFFRELEILTPQWKARLDQPPVIPQWQAEHRAFLRYLMERYWLQAVSDFDIVCRAKLAIASCLLIGFLGGCPVETAQLFSKEIENNGDNIEAILDGAYSATPLTDTQLLGLLFAKTVK